MKMINSLNARFRWWTLACLICAPLIAAVPLLWWWRCGEAFLASTHRVPAEVLVVEGWIGREGVRAAGQEFGLHGYRYVVTSGGPTVERWEERRSTYAELAARELIRSGVPEDKIIVAPAKETERQRTYESAVAVWRALRARAIQPKALDVFSYGTHARRTRLVFAKVFASESNVGMIGWAPLNDEAAPWWRSSDRAKELLTETVGYAYEALFNSGRRSNSPAEETSAGLSPRPAGISASR